MNWWLKHVDVLISRPILISFKKCQLESLLKSTKVAWIHFTKVAKRKKTCMKAVCQKPIGVWFFFKIGSYLLFIGRETDRCQKNVKYLLMIQHQILFLNLLNKCQMKSDDEPSDVFWLPIWRIKHSTHSITWAHWFGSKYIYLDEN